MKSTAKKLITLLLSLVMIVSLVPYTAFASGDYSDGQTCPGCDHYHWGDRMCDDCGGCTRYCTDFCWLGMHCNNCGDCLLDSFESCIECGYCFDCMMENNHCAECYADYIGNGDQLCGNCRRCPDCVGELCPDCGFCVDCANDEEGMHCPECGNCYQITDQCEDITNNHCTDCCNPCWQCNRCMFDADDELCPDCGLCLTCCASNSENSGGTGEVCIESSDWDDHICSDCGGYFELDDLCESCGSAGVIRCPECCESASECSMSMCEYAPRLRGAFLRELRQML